MDEEKVYNITCPKCKGERREDRKIRVTDGVSFTMIQSSCTFCGGTGRLDWIQMVTGGNSEFVDSDEQALDSYTDMDAYFYHYHDYILDDGYDYHNEYNYDEESYLHLKKLCNKRRSSRGSKKSRRGNEESLA